MNEKLKCIAANAATQLATLIAEGEKDILEAWSAAEEIALDNDAKPKLRIGFSITLDLEADAATYALTFGIRRKLEVTEQIPDPNQLELPQKN